MPFFNDTPPKRVPALKTPNAPKKPAGKKSDIIGKSIAMFKKRTLDTEIIELDELPHDFVLDDLSTKLTENMTRVQGPSFTLFTHLGKPIDLVFNAMVDVAEVSYFDPKLCVAVNVDTAVFTPYFEMMFNEIENSGLTVSDQTERMRKGSMVLKLKVDDQFKIYFDESLSKSMRQDSSENMIIDFLGVAKTTRISVTARFGVYIDSVKNMIGIYSTTLLLAL